MGRAHVEHVHAPQLEAEPLAWDGWPEGASVKVLSSDLGTGALTALVMLPAGYRRPAALAPAKTEVLVVSGTLRVGDATFGRCSYLYAPAGSVHAAWESVTDTELLVMARTGPAHLKPTGQPPASAGTILLDGGPLPWGPTPVPNGPPATEVAILRRDEETGEMSVLVRKLGESVFPVFEFHECVEECFMLEGWLAIDNQATEGGDMHPGTYFWRPPFVTHGQSRSRAALFYIYTDVALVNRFTDGFHRTPQENRRQYERELAAAG